MKRAGRRFSELTPASRSALAPDRNASRLVSSNAECIRASDSGSMVEA
jgi:hypothetical protein